MSSNVYIVKPFPDQSDRWQEFQHQSVIAIGWPSLGNLTGANKDKIRILLIAEGYASRSLGNALSQIDCFCNTIQPDDYVIVPHEDVILIGTITSDYTFEPSNAKDGYPHQRSVRWLAKISQTTLSAELTKKLHTPRTIINASDCINEVSTLSKKFAFP